jgi:hypothetical protein
MWQECSRKYDLFYNFVNIGGFFKFFPAFCACCSMLQEKNDNKLKIE